MTGHKNLTLL